MSPLNGILRMPSLPVAVTAAVALSAAGDWAIHGNGKTGAALVSGGKPAGWPRQSLIPGISAAQPHQQECWPVAQITAIGLPQDTIDRAANIGLALADRLQARLPTAWRNNAERVGVSFTISKGGFGAWADHAVSGASQPETASAGADAGAHHAEERWAIQAADGAAGMIAHRLGLGGTRISPVAACATGIANLSCAARLLQTEPLDAVVCGGSESSLHPLLMHSFSHMGILDRAPMRPFDESRSGFNLGEGGALLLLEPAPASDSKRDLRSSTLAYLTAAALIADAHHMTELQSRRPTLTRLMRQLLSERRSAGARKPLAALYINAHGTGTRLNDPWESLQLIEAFGRGGWARTEGLISPEAEVVISGTKSLAGHLLGASAMLEAFLCVAVLNGAPPPPTWNLLRPHVPWPKALKDCKQLHLLCDPQTEISGGPPVRFDAAMTLNYGFGGHVGGAIFERNHHGQ